MANDSDSTKQEYHRKRIVTNPPVSSVVYGLGFLGAMAYYVQHASTFWEGVFGFLMALVWPAMVVYKLMELLKM